MAYVEARAGGQKGIEDVVDVMFNRMDSKHFPNKICANLHKKGQYPWVKNGMPRVNQEHYRFVKTVVEKRYAERRNGTWRDGTNGALFFNNHGKKPVKKAKMVIKRKGHYFFSIKT